MENGELGADEEKDAYDTSASEDEGPSGDADIEYDEPDDDGAENDEDSNETDRSSVLMSLVYCSAPDADGRATLVGLAGAFAKERQVELRSASESVEAFTGQDGGLAVRIAAEPGELVSIVLNAGESGVEIYSIAAGMLLDGSVAPDLIGSEQAEVLDDGNTLIRGDGAGLSDGYLVVGGNISISAGSAAPVSCSESRCVFGLMIRGFVGDEVDLFAVPIDSRSGLLGVQTITL